MNNGGDEDIINDGRDSNDSDENIVEEDQRWIATNSVIIWIIFTSRVHVCVS